jgi:hypothetical protein
MPSTHDLLVVGSVVTPAANPGESAVIAIDAGAHYDTVVTVGGAARQATYPIPGDVIELADGIQVQVTAKDASVTPNRVTLTPLMAADDITGAFAPGDEFAILFNLFAEGSGLPGTRVPRIMKYTNTFGLVKHAWRTTGHELTNSVYHETRPGDPSSAGSSSYVLIEGVQLSEFEKTCSNLLLHGSLVDNLVATGAATETGVDVPITGTEGFIKFATTAGTIDTYGVGTYGLDDFNEVAATMLNERAASSNDLIGWIGPDLFTEIEDSFTATLESNLNHTVDRIVPGFGAYLNNQYQQSLTYSPSDAALSFGYRAVKKNGFVFHLKRLSEFNDIRRAGAAAYDYRNWAIWHPISWTKDSLSGNSRPTVGYEYKELEGYSREAVYSRFAGAGVGGSNTPFGQAVNQFDTMTSSLISHKAGHFACGNGLVVQRPS